MGTYRNMYRARYPREQTKQHFDLVPNTENVQIKFISNLLWADLLLPQWFKPYLGRQKKKNYSALGMVVSNLGFPLPQPPPPSFPVVECRGELKAQKVKKITGWDGNNWLETAVRKKNIESNNISNKTVQKKANHMQNAHHSAHYPYWKRSLLPGTDWLCPGWNQDRGAVIP